MALALYEADTDGEADSKTLRGVIPYTEETSEGGERTYTVEEWLSAVERVKDEKKAHDCQDEQWSLIEGEQ
nr:HTH domain-containing protein [Natrinema sp. SYSU A 869]